MSSKGELDIQSGQRLMNHLQLTKMYWLLGSKSQLPIESKLLLCSNPQSNP